MALDPKTLEAVWNILTVAAPIMAGAVLYRLRGQDKRITEVDTSCMARHEECVDGAATAYDKLETAMRDELERCRAEWHAIAQLRQGHHEETIQRIARLEASHENLANGNSRIERKLDKLLMG